MINPNSLRDVRRQNLLLVLAGLGGHGAQKKLSEKSGIYHTYLSNIRVGNREMGEEIARKIEAAMGLMPGWMDQPHSVMEAEEQDYVAATPEEVALEQRLASLWEQLSMPRRRIALEVLADMVAAEQAQAAPPERSL